MHDRSAAPFHQSCHGQATNFQFQAGSHRTYIHSGDVLIDLASQNSSNSNLKLISKCSLHLRMRKRLRERLRYASRGGRDSKFAAKEENNTWQHSKSRRQSEHAILQTSVSNTKSKKSSPLERRRRSHRPKSPEPTSSSSSDDEAKAESSCTSSLPPQINPSHKLREAVERALGQEASQPGTSKSSAYGWALPKIVEPPIDESISKISLPYDLELRQSPNSGRNSTLKFWSLAIAALLGKANQRLKLLRDRYGAEPPVPKKHVRLCGDELYDDYIEQRPNAARLLEAYLNRPRAHTPRSPSSQSSSASSMASIFDASSRVSTLTTPSSTYGGWASWGKRSDTSRYSPTRIRPNNPFSVRMPTQVEESTPKVVHIDVNEGRIRSDKDLALALREHYDQLNNHWYSWARLRGLTTIEFVQFEVHRNRFADIRATPSMPPKSASSSSNSPGPEKYQSPSQHPYTFEPNDLLPPVGSTYLLHLFQHPADYSTMASSSHMRGVQKGGSD
ncbi:predicted protein [Plenodomus lingam JN3]|uniref:Predicted protein n=1 Tax=Leptosphaeria maculans (strain JN3 / isolate v23.1.3 / race Av1-4-5-6-7-8) TaxID=985895 RepID=E4ZJM6_LEPMJ|nr:predicted protein [Plenodomus lingam JN3]CBX91311.1 predicted protein [Plenodomus lingam JN3]